MSTTDKSTLCLNVFRSHSQFKAVQMLTLTDHGSGSSSSGKSTKLNSCGLASAVSEI